MYINICDHSFDSEEIKDIIIRDHEILIDSINDFYRFKYTSKEEIRDAILWEKLQKITHKDIQDAIIILIAVCDYFINSKTQCSNCPLTNQKGCMLNAIPIDWRE